MAEQHAQLHPRHQFRAIPGLLAASDGELDWVFWVAAMGGLFWVVCRVRERRAGD